MGFGSKPKRPEYEQQADTPWITRNRDMNTWSYDNVANNINRVNVFDDATRQSLNDYVDDIYNRAKSDFEGTYNRTMAKTLANDYNRWGTTGGSNALYNRDQYNKARQRELADLAYDRATTYEDMINNELDRRYKFLNTNYGYFTNSGKTIQDFDDANWRIRNANKDIQYLNDIQDYNSKMNTWNAVGKVGSMALGAAANALVPGSGLIVTGLGNSLTDAFASPMDVGGNSAFNIYGGGTTGYAGNSYDTDWGVVPRALYGNNSSLDWSKLKNLFSRLKGGPTGVTPQIGQLGSTSLNTTSGVANASALALLNGFIP